VLRINHLKPGMGEKEFAPHLIRATISTKGNPWEIFSCVGLCGDQAIFDVILLFSQ
jgi:hypothetical protein